MADKVRFLRDPLGKVCNINDLSFTDFLVGSRWDTVVEEEFTEYARTAGIERNVVNHEMWALRELDRFFKQMRTARPGDVLHVSGYDFVVVGDEESYNRRPSTGRTSSKKSTGRGSKSAPKRSASKR